MIPLGRQIEQGYQADIKLISFQLRLFEESRKVGAKAVKAARARSNGDEVAVAKASSTESSTFLLQFPFTESERGETETTTLHDELNKVVRSIDMLKSADDPRVP